MQAIRSFKHLPALNIDLLAHNDPRRREEALSDIVVRVWVGRSACVHLVGRSSVVAATTAGVGLID